MHTVRELSQSQRGKGKNWRRRRTGRKFAIPGTDEPALTACVAATLKLHVAELKALRQNHSQGPSCTACKDRPSGAATLSGTNFHYMPLAQ